MAFTSQKRRVLVLGASGKIGQMVQALDETGQMENTIFVFTSDHGEMAGDHRMWEKRAFYEESARVPFLMHVPWLNAEQTRVDGVFGHADLIPTLLDLAELPIPDQCQGGVWQVL